MKKIAILSYYTGRSNRGVESWAQQLKSHLSSMFQIDIYSGLDVYNPFSYLKYDIVIATGGRIEALLSRLATWVGGRRLVIFGHSGPGADDKWNLLCLPDVFVSFSNSQFAWANKYKLGTTKTVIISHAVDTKVFVPGTKRVTKNVVLCVAANTPSKRIELVKQAVEAIENSQLLLVGPGNEMQVKFEKMPEIYQQAKLFCFVPQPWESFGLVFLEALSSNLPVVTIDDPVRQEIVGEAGILVKNPENIQDLSVAIKKCLSTDWGRKPRQQASKFSWDKIALQYHQLFKTL